MKATAKYNKSEIMKAAWSEFKNESNWESSFTYIFSFAECLKTAWAMAKSGSAASIIAEDLSVEEIYNTIFLMADEINADIILTEVAEKSNGFQSDIAKRALRTGRLSSKQAWCVAYEFKNVA